MWLRHPFFKYMTAIILTLIVLLLLGQLDYVVNPIQTMLGTLFFPLLFAGFLYYVMKPLVNIFLKIKFMTKPISIVLVFTVLIVGVSLLIYSIGGVIEQQVNELQNELPKKFEETAGKTEQFMNETELPFISLEEVKQTFFQYIKEFTANAGKNLGGIISTIANFATVLVIVPFILFYLLKDDHRFAPFLLTFIPEKHKSEGKRILSDIHTTLSTYIVGQMLVACVNGVLMYIGYLILGLDYALVLAIFVVITAIIPILGPLLGVIPAIFVAMMGDPFTIVKIGILLVIVQQLEGNLVSPLVIGNRLKLHPLTVILLLLVAGSMYGFIGILIVIPVYSVLKVTIQNAVRFYKLRFVD
ncbi:AI-2E family transporter [Bacillus weihaiensis]|uniref:AI-2E family transporter n=1 Tax=Bacillus weihaiensis TaxID=1547283 RepID=A0A1L3MW75_9BACI|nr:AI-2E family transporter [Bacillus weihaiensis]APH06584.1 AI-2E family transporter [Bacillus weihaiensis]